MAAPNMLRTPLPMLVERATGYTLSPAQEALLLLATGSRIQDLKGKVQRAAIQAVGFNRSRAPVRTLFLNKGARGGGTMMTAYLAVHRALVCDLSGLAPGEEARVGFLSATMRQARAGLRYARGLIRALHLDSIVEQDRAESFTIKRGDRSIEFSVIRGNADQLAGFWWAALCVHECAIAVDPSGGSSPLDLEAVEKAIRPRLIPPRGQAPGGLLMEETTSRDAVGPAFERVRDHFGKADAPMMIFKASTLELRPDDRALHEHVEAEERADFLNAQREFHCEWVAAGGSGLVFAPELLDAATNADWSANLTPNVTAESWAGADLGFTSDGSGLAIIRRSITTPTGMELAALRRWNPRREKLGPTEVIAQLLDECERHGTRILLADVHHFEQLREAAAARKNVQVIACPTGAAGKQLTHSHAMELLASGSFVMGADHQLRRDLQRIVAIATPDGAVKIRAPRSKSKGHGDLGSAFVLAAYAARHFGQRARDPDFHIRPPSGMLVDLGLVDAEGRFTQRPASIEFGIDETTGRAYAQPAHQGGAWDSGGSGQFSKGGF